MSLPYLIWLDAMQDAVTDADLYGLDVDDQVLSCRRIRARDATPMLRIELYNPGWGLWQHGQGRACALVTSEDGTMATARVWARGEVRTSPPDITGDTLTVDVELCLDEDALAAAKESAAVAVLGVPLPSQYDPDGTLIDTEPTAEQLPYLDRLFGRPQRYADAIGQTRHGWFALDPVTHSVTWRDHAYRKRLINLGDAYDVASLRTLTNGSAYREIRCELACSFTLTATGTCDVGSWVGPVVGLSGYSGGASQTMAENVGWTLGQPKVQTIKGLPVSLETGRVYVGRYQPVYYEQRDIAGSNPPQQKTVTRYGPEEERRHVQTKEFDVLTTRFTSWPATYNWSQQIREVATFRLRVPVQEGATAPRQVLEMPQVSLQDPHTVDGLAGVAAHRDGQTYRKDDLVQVGGGIYRASVDGLTAFWILKTVGRYSFKRVELERDPRWVDTGYRPPLEAADAREFLATPRGQACMAGMFLRMRVRALDALQSWTVSFTALRSDLPDVDLEDNVRITLPGRAGTDEGKAVVGRVMRVEEVWHGDEGETVDVVLAIPLGDGSDAAARAGHVGAYVSPEYVDPEYVEQDGAHSAAGPDIEWQWSAEAIRLPVEPDALPLPSYSVRSVAKTSELGEQIAAFRRLALSGQPPDNPDSLPKANVALGLVPLLQEPVLDRAYTVDGDLTVAPMGINLAGASEPR